MKLFYFSGLLINFTEPGPPSVASSAWQSKQFLAPYEVEPFIIEIVRLQ